MFISRGITNDGFKWKENEDGGVTITGYTGNGGEVAIPSEIDSKFVTSIGSYAFKNCTGLTNITIPDSITEIGYGAFEDCTGLTSVTIGTGVTWIGMWAFSGCIGLTSMNIDKDNKYYTSDNSVLFNKDKSFLIIYPAGKKGAYIIPNSVTYIVDLAFEDCTELTSVIIPESVTVIGTGAFYGCIGLTDVTIPNSVTLIDTSAFKNCTGLTSITIPDSVTKINYNVFDECEALTVYGYKSSYVENYCKENGFKFEKII